MNDLTTLVKRLRSETGIGVLHCKNALVNSNLDYDKAVRLLRESGQMNASKVSTRITSDGLVGYKIVNNTLAVLELNCETDFAARSDRMQDLLDNLIDFEIKFKTNDSQIFLNCKLEDDRTVSQVIADQISAIGENITVGIVKSFDFGKSLLSAYVHNAAEHINYFGQIVSVVFLEYEGQEKRKVLDFGKKIAMHIAAMSPRYLSIENIPDDIIASERSIHEKRIQSSDKPKNIIDKIVAGNMQKFYENVVLLEQFFIMDNKLHVGEIIDAFSKEIGSKIAISNFVRIKVGDK